MNQSQPSPVIGIVMGSQSDLTVMSNAVTILKEMDLTYDLTIVSAHRTPARMYHYATTAAQCGLKVIIAGAGGAAHLPGMIAALTHLPVIGVPIQSSNSLYGWDAILSVLQMPSGVPVATVALNAAKNAGLLATQILAIGDKCLSDRLITYKENLKKAVEVSATQIKQQGYHSIF